MKVLDLPRELVEEILSRIPLKSMRQIRLSCKNWDTLSKSRSFFKMHIGKEEERSKEGESLMVLLMNYTLYLTSMDANNDPYRELKGKLSCLDEQVKISHVFHCEGLLLCILKGDKFTLVVWNPYLGQTRRIKPKRFHSYPYKGYDNYMYALGYENKKKKSCLSHKILRFLDLRMSDFWWSPNGNLKVWYEIYDFDSSSWTTLDVPRHWRIPCDAPGVSLNGNTYWRARISYSIDEFLATINHIICFDFTSERFGPLLPLPFTAFFNDFVSLSCVKEEKLAALFQVGHHSKIGIWITTKIEAEMVLWSKFLTVDTGPVVNNRISFVHGSFFIDEEKKVAVVFDQACGTRRYTAYIIGEDGYFRKLDLGECTERECWTLVCSYVPSLEQIKQRRGKRKRQSKIIKHSDCT